MNWISLGAAVAQVIENCAEEYVKQKGLPLKGYRMTKEGKLVPSKAALPAHKRIANRTKKTYKPRAKVQP